MLGLSEKEFKKDFPNLFAAMQKGFRMKTRPELNGINLHNEKIPLLSTVPSGFLVRIFQISGKKMEDQLKIGTKKQRAEMSSERQQQGNRHTTQGAHRHSPTKDKNQLVLYIRGAKSLLPESIPTSVPLRGWLEGLAERALDGASLDLGNALHDVVCSIIDFKGLCGVLDAKTAPVLGGRFLQWPIDSNIKWLQGRSLASQDVEKLHPIL